MCILTQCRLLVPFSFCQVLLSSRMATLLGVRPAQPAFIVASGGIPLVSVEDTNKMKGSRTPPFHKAGVNHLTTSIRKGSRTHNVRRHPQTTKTSTAALARRADLSQRPSAAALPRRFVLPPRTRKTRGGSFWGRKCVTSEFWKAFSSTVEHVISFS